MIIFLYGLDSYRRQKKQEWVVAEYRAKHSNLTIEQFNFEDEGALDRARDFIKNQSLFDAYKLVIIHGLYMIVNNKEGVGWFKSLQDVSGVVVLVVAHGAPPKQFSFLLEKPTVCDVFPLLEGVALKKFVEREAVRRGARLSDEVLTYLHVMYAGDMWGLMTELDALALMTNNQLPMINYLLRRDFFSLAKALAYGKGHEKISVLEELLYTDDSVKIFNMLAVLVSGEKKIQMADYDVAIKSGVLDYDAALLDFAIR